MWAGLAQGPPLLVLDLLAQHFERVVIERFELPLLSIIKRDTKQIAHVADALT